MDNKSSVNTNKMKPFWITSIPASDVTVLLHTVVPSSTEVIAEMQQE